MRIVKTTRVKTKYGLQYGAGGQRHAAAIMLLSLLLKIRKLSLLTFKSSLTSANGVCALNYEQHCRVGLVI